MLVDIPSVPCVRHDDYHRHGFLVCDGTVGNRFHLSHLYPVGFIVRITMQEVEDRIIPFRGVVVGRQVDGVGDFPT